MSRCVRFVVSFRSWSLLYFIFVFRWFVRESIGIFAPRKSLSVCFRHSIASTYRLIKRVPMITFTASLSDKANGTQYVVFPKRIRSVISPRSRNGRPFASPSRGIIASLSSYFSHPSNNASRFTIFIREPVSKTALNGNIVCCVFPIEYDTT